MFTDSTTKVDSEPPNGSNDDITNLYECNQTLYFSAGTSNSSAEFVYESEPEPTQRYDSLVLLSEIPLIVSKKSYPRSKKMSKRQPITGGSNEGTGNILGVPDKSTVVSRVSSEGTGSKLGVPDEEKHMRLWLDQTLSL
ncbi:hypothetical protein Tco_0019051 [Tanacetum coccineum]